MFRQMGNGRAGTRQAAGGHGLSDQYARTDLGKYTFAVRTAESNLPDDVKSAPNREVFRIRMGKLSDIQ
jgi:hypothetical protein